MSSIQLIADAGATKTQWCVIGLPKKKTVYTKGISPYFLGVNDIVTLIDQELKPSLKNVQIEKKVFFTILQVLTALDSDDLKLLEIFQYAAQKDWLHLLVQRLIAKALTKCTEHLRQLQIADNTEQKNISTDEGMQRIDKAKYSFLTRTVFNKFEEGG